MAHTVKENAPTVRPTRHEVPRKVCGHADETLLLSVTTAVLHDTTARPKNIFFLTANDVPYALNITNVCSYQTFYLSV